jgi:hypothetical protein
MILSFSKKFIFIHIHKTAGSSVKNVLNKYSWYPEESIYCTILKKLNLRPYTEDFHDHVRAWEIKEFISPKIFSEVYKFTFVRNPWDWMLSSYTYYLKHKYMHPHSYFADQLKTFKGFVKWQTSNRLAFHNQYEFIYDQKGNCLVDHIGKFENLESEFNSICNRLGIKEKLPHINISKELGYRHEYDDETKDIVFKYYKKDIDIFSYEF